MKIITCAQCGLRFARHPKSCGCPRCEAPSAFCTFLSWQVNIDHPVGDLARDVRDDPVRPHFRSLAEWVRYLRADSPAGAGIYDALIEAWRDFARVAATRPADRRPPRHGGVRTDAPRAISLSLRQRIFERDGFRCRRCGNTPVDCKLVIDHILPVVLGGTKAEDNLQTLCEWCNIGKGDRPPHPHDYAVPR